MHFKALYLVEHSSVARYASEVLANIHLELERAFNTTCVRLTKDTLCLNDLETNSIVFYIGQEGKIYQNKDSIYVVFICLSIFCNPRGLTGLSWQGLQELNRRKLKIEKNILPSVDHILDYHPGHTIRLKEIYGNRLSIDWFPLSVSQAKYFSNNKNAIESFSKPWDVCIVGSITPRRRKIYSRLSSLGLILSPHLSHDLADAIIKSKIVLNIHAFKHDNIEFPRLLTAFMARVPVLSEPCYSLESIMPSPAFLESPIKDIVHNAVSLCSNYLLRKRYAKRAASWLETYNSDIEPIWNALAQELTMRAIAKLYSNQSDFSLR